MQRASVESGRTGGQHSQQRVQLVWTLAAGGSLLSASIGRLEMLPGNVEPAIGQAVTQDGGRVRVTFACGSAPIVVTPPTDWNGQRPTVQRASVESGRPRILTLALTLTLTLTLVS